MSCKHRSNPQKVGLQNFSPLSESQEKLWEIRWGQGYGHQPYSQSLNRKGLNRKETYTEDNISKLFSCWECVWLHTKLHFYKSFISLDDHQAYDLSPLANLSTVRSSGRYPGGAFVQCWTLRKPNKTPHKDCCQEKERGYMYEPISWCEAFCIPAWVLTREFFPIISLRSTGDAYGRKLMPDTDPEYLVYACVCVKTVTVNASRPGFLKGSWWQTNLIAP